MCNTHIPGKRLQKPQARSASPCRAPRLRESSSNKGALYYPPWNMASYIPEDCTSWKRSPCWADRIASVDQELLRELASHLSSRLTSYHSSISRGAGKIQNSCAIPLFSCWPADSDALSIKGTLLYQDAFSVVRCDELFFWNLLGLYFNFIFLFLCAEMRPHEIICLDSSSWVCFSTSRWTTLSVYSKRDFLFPLGANNKTNHRFIFTSW